MSEEDAILIEFDGSTELVGVTELGRYDIVDPSSVDSL